MTNESLLENLSSLPRLTDVFVWCDYIELRCLVHPDKTLSRSDLNETQEEMAEVCDDSFEMANEEYADDVDLTLDEFERNDYFSSPPVKEDRMHQRTSERFNHLQKRSLVYGDSYPFELDDDLQSLTLKDPLEPLHYLYLQLMLSSLLRYCKRNRRQELTNAFEFISYKIFKCLMPNGWEVYQFGKEGSTRYQGHLFDKLKALAEDVRGTLSRYTTKDSFSRHDSGDGGLDLVAWHPMFDDRPLIPIAFAQCGCTPEEFDVKMLEASPSKLGNHLHTNVDWHNYYFMPQSMQANGKEDWFRYSQFGKSIVIDRLRILRFVAHHQINPQQIVSQQTLHEVQQMEFT